MNICTYVLLIDDFLVHDYLFSILGVAFKSSMSSNIDSSNGFPPNQRVGQEQRPIKRQIVSYYASNEY